MGRTRTAGIISDADGSFIVNKEVLGHRIYARLGKVTQEQAERWLADRVQRITLAKERGTRPRVTFREAAARYLSENRDRLASAEDAAWHVLLLDPFIGARSLDEIYNETLQPFKDSRQKTVSVTTINRSLEIVRRILNLAHRMWRHPNGMTWLESAPLIKLDTDLMKRKPYPLSWDEQRLLFSMLPGNPNAQMALFKVNTGTREQEVCYLRWEWEYPVPELGEGVSVFIVPAIFSEDGKHGVKNREDRLVVLNNVARSIVNARRGIHNEFVFSYRGHRLTGMNNTGWQNARRRAAKKYQEEFQRPAPWGFANVRVHDLKHTFGRRLRAAGVALETRRVLLGHKDGGDITTHYSAAEIGELIDAVNRIDASRATPSITLLGRNVGDVESRKVAQLKKTSHSKVA